MLLGELFLSAEEIKEGKVRNKIGKPFMNYQKAVKKINLLGWIKEEIDKRPERTIVVKISDVAKELGPSFEKYKYGSLYQGLRYVLFYNGFTISTGTHKDGDKVFIIKEKKEGDRLAPSYRELEIKAETVEEKKKEKKKEIEDRKKEIDKGELAEIVEKRLKIIKEREETSLEIQKKRDDLHKEKVALEKEHQKIKKEKDEILLEIQKQRDALQKEKVALEEIRKEKEDIEKLKQILDEKFGNKIYVVEIFQFNWKTLAWKLIKRKSIKNYIHLFDLIIEYTSALEDRYRFELTPVNEIKESVEKIGQKEQNEAIEKDKDFEIECPRCGSKNIRTWSTIKVIRTRSGERKLRYRCEDCNETFGDEDIVRLQEIKVI